MINYNAMRQKGFSLIELLIGIVVGLIAVAAIVSAFTTIVLSNADYLKMIRLNQELNSMMTLMTRDLKRAGHSGSADGIAAHNPFMQPSPATVTGQNIFIGVSPYTGSGPDDCITFTYDINGDGNVDAAAPGVLDERFGYRFDRNDSAIEARESGKTCAEGSWENITDDQSVIITNLAFTNDYLSLTDDNNGEIRYIIITLSGQLANDPTVSRTLTERIRVRNDRP